MNPPFKCHVCGEHKVSFWSHEFGFPCEDCRDLERKATEERRLREAVASGRVKVEQLTPLGRKVCGITL